MFTHRVFPKSRALSIHIYSYSLTSIHCLSQPFKAVFVALPLFLYL